MRPVVGLIPAPLWSIVDLIAGAAVPCALVSLGIALRRYGLASGIGLPAILSFLSGFSRMISSLSLARRRADLTQQKLEERAALLKRERIAALSLAEDAEQARNTLEAITKESQR